MKREVRPFFRVKNGREDEGVIPSPTSHSQAGQIRAVPENCSTTVDKQKEQRVESSRVKLNFIMVVLYPAVKQNLFLLFGLISSLTAVL